MPVESLGRVRRSYNRDDKVTGTIKSITDFGLFHRPGRRHRRLVHLSDISWELAGEDAVRNYRKGEEVEAMVLAIDSGARADFARRQAAGSGSHIHFPCRASQRDHR